MDISYLQDLCHTHFLARPSIHVDFDISSADCITEILGGAEGARYIDRLVKAGGFLMSYQSQADIDALVTYLTSEQAVAYWKERKPSFLIGGLREIAECLTTSQLEAILYHEFGHIVNEDIGEAGTVVCLNEGLEIRADDYAIKHVGAARLYAALGSIPKAVASLFEDGGRFEGCVDSNQVIAAFNMPGVFKSRMLRLEQMLGI